MQRGGVPHYGGCGLAGAYDMFRPACGSAGLLHHTYASLFPRARAQVRSLRESRGDVTEAGPSIAVQMAGLNGVPTAGDEFAVCDSEQEVRAQGCLIWDSFVQRRWASPKLGLLLMCRAGAVTNTCSQGRLWTCSAAIANATHAAIGSHAGVESAYFAQLRSKVLNL